VGYSVKNLGSEILLFEDLLEPQLCDHLMEVAEFCHFESATILIGSVDTEVRNSGILALDRRQPIQKAANDLVTTQIKVIQEALFQAYGVKFPHAEPCSILRYSPSQQYKRHIDNILLASRFQEVEQGIPTRDVSIVGYLNDDFEGGETFFDRQEIKVKPKKGSAIVFPSYYTHPHQSLPVTRGRKYSWTSWLYH
jgi:prolyl 4-hydroxylase